MMTDAVYDAIVIGAGPGGSTCAALLAKRGLKTLLVEKNKRIGGKAMTVSKQGFSYELWPVTGGPRSNSQFEAVLTELGMEPELADPEIYVTYHYPDSRGKFQPFIQPVPGSSNPETTADPAALLNWLGLSPGDMGGLIRLVTDTAALSPEDVDRLDEMTYHDYLSNYDIPKSFYSYLAAQCNVLFVVPFDQLAASEGIKTTAEISKDGAGFYHLGGYGRLFEKYIEAFVQLGGDLLTDSRVERIVITEGKASGILTDKGEFQAPIIISNAGIQPTVLKLVGEKHFESDYVNYIKTLVPSLALMGTRYFLDAPVLDGAYHIAFSDNSYWNGERAVRAQEGRIPDELLIFMTIPSNFDPNLAPSGKQCLLVSTLCPPDPEMENKQLWWERIDNQVANIWPEISGHVEFKEHFSTKDVSMISREQVLPKIGGECIGLAQIVGQCGRHKPSVEAPLPGLFYVGCDAGGYGCGTHQAVTSGVNVARLVHVFHEKRLSTG